MTETTKEKSLASVNQAKKGRQRWNGVEKKERSRITSDAVQHRWKGVAQTEQELQEYFKSVDLDTALETYYAMRKQYESAGKIVDTRVQAERNAEECANCGKKFDKDSPWFNREPTKDYRTGVLYNIFSCSQACMIALKGKGVKRAGREMRA